MSILDGGQIGIAKTVFYRTLRLQTLMAAVVSLAGLLAIWFFAEPQYRVIGLFLIGSIFPSMVNSIAAGANTALEDLRANVPASLVSTGIFVTAAFSSIYFGWGLAWHIYRYFHHAGRGARGPIHTVD